MDEGFLERLVGVFVFDVFADDADEHLVAGIVGTVDEGLPLAHVGVFGVDVEIFEDELIDSLLGEGQGTFVDAGDVAGGDDGALLDVAEEGDLALHLLRQEAVGAAEEDVGLDSDGEQLLDGVLGGLGLELSGGGDEGNEGDVDEERVFAAVLLAHLADGFEEGKRFDVADGAADFADDDIDIVRDLFHGGFDFVGDVRNDLHGFAEIVAAALLGDDLLVDAAGGEVVVAGEAGVGEALVVAEVEVGLGAVVGDEDFAMLEGRHGSGIDVEIGIELLQADAQAAAFQQAADAGSGQSLAERRDDAAGYKDVLCRHIDLVTR